VLTKEVQKLKALEKAVQTFLTFQAPAGADKKPRVFWTPGLSCFGEGVVGRWRVKEAR